MDGKILEALETINRLKEQQRQKKQTNYMRNYKQEEVNKLITDNYRKMPDDANMRHTL